VLLIVGLLIGLVLGLTGAGGSVFAVPLLILLMGIDPQTAMGLSLGAVASSASLGVLAKLSSGDIQWLPAIAYAGIGALLAPVGVYLNQRLPADGLMLGFAVLVLVVAMRLWRQAQDTPALANEVRSSLNVETSAGPALCRANALQPFRLGLPCIMSVSAGAMATGILSGLFGVGGGFLIVPSLMFLLACTIRQAVATSLVVISVISLSGFISFLWQGNNIAPDVLMWLAAGGLLGMMLGVVLSKYIAGSQLQKIFSIMMVLMAALSLFSQLNP